LVLRYEKEYISKISNSKFLATLKIMQVHAGSNDHSTFNTILSNTRMMLGKSKAKLAYFGSIIYVRCKRLETYLS
jgi:hypothetical protein